MPKRKNKLTEIVKTYKTKNLGTIYRRAGGQFVGLNEACEWYNKCPICYRCDNAAPNIYDRCSDCPAQGCNHSVIDRNLMIKRKNK